VAALGWRHIDYFDGTTSLTFEQPTKFLLPAHGRPSSAALDGMQGLWGRKRTLDISQTAKPPFLSASSAWAQSTWRHHGNTAKLTSHVFAYILAVIIASENTIYLRETVFTIAEKILFAQPAK